MLFLKDPMSATPEIAYKTTDVLGYYNFKDFPINLASDNLGINTMVVARSYVKDRDGNLINDPVLDYYAKLSILVKEYSKTPVPLRLIRRPNSHVPISPDTSVRSAGPVRATLNPGSPLDVLPADPRGQSKDRMALLEAEHRASIPQAQPGAHSTAAMSIEYAIKMGYINQHERKTDKFDTAPNEDTNGDTSRTAPYIDEVMGATKKRPPTRSTGAPPAPVPGSVVTGPIVVDEAAKQAADKLLRDKAAALTAGTILSGTGQPMSSVPASAAPTEVNDSAPLSTLVPVDPEPPAPAVIPTVTKPAATIVTKKGGRGVIRKLRAPKIEYDGTMFTRVGDLKQYLKRKMGSDDLAEDALAAFLADEAT
jgi:hypothetical protein